MLKRDGSTAGAEIGGIRPLLTCLYELPKCFSLCRNTQIRGAGHCSI